VDRYVVVGNPVSHSKSPLIHTCFAEQTGQALEYSALLAEEGHFVETMQGFFEAGGKGANVTVPFKQEAFALVDKTTPEAETARAVNTLYLDETGCLCGHNTDGLGLVRDVTANFGGTLKDRYVLILGAGGATRGILQPFLKQGPAEIVIANRTASKAEALAEVFSRLAREMGQHTEVTGCGFDGLGSKSYDWLFNATSASLQGEMPPLPTAMVSEASVCYDLMYSSQTTPFCQWAKNLGAGQVMDGLGMLVEQAAESFLVWRGIRPETGSVLKLLKSA